MDEPSANDYDVHRPHDSLFRAVFSDPAAAVGFLRAYLPESVSAGLQWSTLALRNNTFIDDALRDSESDLLFAVQRRSGRPAWLYVLTVETVAGELKGRIAQLTMMAVYRDQWPVLQRVVRYWRTCTGAAGWMSCGLLSCTCSPRTAKRSADGALVSYAGRCRAREVMP